MSERGALDMRDDLRELAECYETVAALDLTPPGPVGHAAPGSRVPPGMQEVLNADEVGRALTAVDDWTEFIAHIIATECDVVMPDLTPARLRAVGGHTSHLTGHDDELLALSVRDDLDDHLRALRYLASRGQRRVETGHRCDDPTCRGHYVSRLGMGDGAASEADLVCDRCGHRVPHIVWSRWPRQRVTFITAEHAAKMSGVSLASVWQRAKRQSWRRVGSGRQTRYHVDDVRGQTAG